MLSPARRAALVIAVFATICVSPWRWPVLGQQTIGGPTSFSFVAMGDMPYRVPEDWPRFDRLIATVNALKPAFSIHVGDTKNGSNACTDAHLEQVLERFRAFEQPLVFTPGDNDWTDCHRSRTGQANPRARLAKVREMFFAKPDQSLGKAPMAVEAQPRVQPEHAAYVENARFWKNGVLVVTIHVVGSNNGFETTDPEAAVEFFARNAANIAWLDASFKLAADGGAKAVVVALQANLHDVKQKVRFMPPGSGHTATVRAIERGAKLFGRPILIVHGDDHELEIDGFRGTDYKRIANVLRLQVMGEDYVHAVRVLVDPDSPGVFGFMPLIVPGNGAF